MALVHWKRVQDLFLCLILLLLLLLQLRFYHFPRLFLFSGCFPPLSARLIVILIGGGIRLGLNLARVAGGRGGACRHGNATTWPLLRNALRPVDILQRRRMILIGGELKSAKIQWGLSLISISFACRSYFRWPAHANLEKWFDLMRLDSSFLG